MQFKFKKNSKAFTLLEILIVVAIISFLAGIVIIAINPGKQLANTRNTERRSDVEQIDDALTQYYLDHNSYPNTILGTLTEVCNTSNIPFPATEADCGSLINLSVLVPTYLVSIPVDPQGPLALNPFIKNAQAATNGTGYYIMKDTTSKIVVVSGRAELETVIAIGTTTSPFIEVDPLVSHTLTYDANGGSGAPTSRDIEEGSPITLSATEPTRSDYIFTAWNTESDGTGDTYDPSASFTMGISNVTLYAQWTSIILVNGDVYYNAAVDTSWDTIGNWWTDQNYTTPLGRLPIDGDTVYLDGQMDTPPSTPITASAIYAGSISESLRDERSYGLNFSGVIGDATFTYFAYNIGTINGNAILGGNGCGANNQGTINGNANFYYCNKNQGTINGNAEFYHSAYNDSGHITGDATFYGDSINNGWYDYSYGYYVDGTATFYENSINGAAIETGIFHDSSYTNVSYVEFATFYDNSYNSNSVITNTAIFNDYSHNSYDITGTADFNGSSDMSAGTVNICNFNESSTYSAGAGCTICNGAVCPPVE